MAPTTPLETKRQLHKGPAVCAIRGCLDGCKAAYLGVAIVQGLVPNWDRTFPNSAIQLAHFFISLYKNPSPNKSDMDCRTLIRNKTNMAFCSRGGVVQMRNELREGPATAC